MSHTSGDPLASPRNVHKELTRVYIIYRFVFQLDSVLAMQHETALVELGKFESHGDVAHLDLAIEALRRTLGKAKTVSMVAIV